MDTPFNSRSFLRNSLCSARESLDALKKNRAEGRSDAYANGWTYLNHDLDNKILKESQRVALLKAELLIRGSR